MIMPLVTFDISLAIPDLNLISDVRFLTDRICCVDL